MAPVFYRAPRILTAKRRVSNLSLVGVRIYSDDLFNIGERLELEFFLPDGTTVNAIGKVVWTNDMPPGKEALYDLGLEFIELSENAIKQLKTVLEK